MLIHLVSTILVLLVIDPTQTRLNHNEVEASPPPVVAITSVQHGTRCDFDKYSTGCYSRSGLVCNQDTNMCQCDPDFPVSIGNICVKRVKANQICQYNEQCDNENGFYCSYSDHKHINNCLSLEAAQGVTAKCRCIRLWHKLETYYDQTNSNYHQQQHKYQLQSHTSENSFGDQSSSSATSSSSKYRSTQPTAQSSSILPRLLWFVLISCLLGLCLFLLYIKVHEIGSFENSFQQHEDRLSINSEPDVPPPYEIAIRMKQ